MDKIKGTLRLLFKGFGEVEVDFVFLNPFLSLLFGLLLGSGPYHLPIEFFIVLDKLILLYVHLSASYAVGFLQIFEVVSRLSGMLFNNVLVFVIFEELVKILLI